MFLALLCMVCNSLLYRQQLLSKHYSTPNASNLMNSVLDAHTAIMKYCKSSITVSYSTLALYSRDCEDLSFYFFFMLACQA